jgi:hypothetical protein
LELILEKPKLMCIVQISSKTFVLVVKLGLESSIPSLFYGDGIDCCTFGGS